MKTIRNPWQKKSPIETAVNRHWKPKKITKKQIASARKAMRAFIDNPPPRSTAIPDWVFVPGVGTIDTSNASNWDEIYVMVQSEVDAVKRSRKNYE